MKSCPKCGNKYSTDYELEGQCPICLAQNELNLIHSIPGCGHGEVAELAEALRIIVSIKYTLKRVLMERDEARRVAVFLAEQLKEQYEVRRLDLDKYWKDNKYVQGMKLALSWKEQDKP